MQTELGPRERGLAALRQGDAAGAVTLLTEAVRLDPTDADACSALGVALCQNGRAEASVLALRRAVELQPDRAPLHFNLARGLELTGHLAGALEEYRRVLVLDPRHQSAANGVQRLAATTSSLEPPRAEAPPVADFLFPTQAVASSGASVDSPTSGVQQPTAPPAVSPAQSLPHPHPVASVIPGPVTAPAAHFPASPTAQTQRRSTSPWGLVAIVVGVFLAMGVITFVVIAAVLLPAVKGAREAARRTQPQPYVGTGTPADPYRPVPAPPTGIDLATPAAPKLDLGRAGGGPRMTDGGFGFRVAFPADFPSPRLSGGVEPMGMGGTSRRTMYQSTIEGRLAYVVAYALPAEVYDKLPQATLYDLGLTALKASGGQVTQQTSTQYQGNEAQDVRFSTTAAGTTRAGRARVVLARPRVLIVAFESPEQGDLEQPGVTAFLDSLEIEAKENIPGVQAPIEVPSHPVLTDPPPVPSIPTPSAPNFTPPPVPDLPRPPTPELPDFPTSPGVPEGLRSRLQRFGPSGPRFTPRIPAPPGFGAPSGEGPGSTPSAPGTESTPAPWTPPAE